MKTRFFFFYQKYTNQKESCFQNLFGLLYFSYVFIEMTYIEYKIKFIIFVCSVAYSYFFVMEENCVGFEFP